MDQSNQAAPSQGASAPAASLGPPAGQYEFNEAENAVFTNLGNAVRLVGTMALALGTLMVLGFFVLLYRHKVGHASLSLVQGTVMLVMGIWCRDVSVPINLIVTSAGSDITHLMNAMQKLHKIYSLTQTLLLASIMLVGLTFFIGM